MSLNKSSAAEPVVSVRKLPTSTGRPAELPRWEVSYGCEATGWQVIGWIEEHRLRGAKNPFSFAIGLHPRTGSSTGSKATLTSMTE